MITKAHMVEEKPNAIGGVQRLYRVGNWGLSVIDSPMAHSFRYAWEAAVLKYDADGNWHLTYDTPLTQDVEVFFNDDEANEFLDRAFAWFEANPAEATPVAEVKAAREKRKKDMKKMLDDMKKSQAERGMR